MSTDKQETVLSVATSYARAAEVYSQIDGILAVADALTDMLKNFERCARNAGISIDCTVEDVKDDLAALRETMTRSRNRATDIATSCRNEIGSRHSADVRAYVAGLSPADLVALIREVK